MNPAGMMTSMMMGTAVAGQMGQMMNNMGNNINQNMAQQPAQPTPPPMPGGVTPPPMPGGATPPPMPQQNVEVFINVNGQQFGPCDMANLQQLAQQGQINPQTMAWMNGMPQWAAIGSIPALAQLFQAPQAGSIPPPMPPQM